MLAGRADYDQLREAIQRCGQEQVGKESFGSCASGKSTNELKHKGAE